MRWVTRKRASNIHSTQLSDVYKKKLQHLCWSGGRGGIRTRGSLRYVRFRVECLKPDSATLPDVRKRTNFHFAPSTSLRKQKGRGLLRNREVSLRWKNPREKPRPNFQGNLPHPRLGPFIFSRSQKWKTIWVLGGTRPETPSPINRSGRSARRSRRRIAQAIA